MIATEEEARQFVAGLGGADSIDRLEILVSLLEQENKSQNLVAAASLSTMWQRHIADSAQLLLHVTSTSGVWVDLGTGAGFPGVVVAALLPDVSVICVESRRRRCDWLRRAALAMGLSNLAVHEGRLESFPSIEATTISARAFAPLDKLLSLSARFSTMRTEWVLPKGRSARQELDALPRRVSKLFHVEQSRTEQEAGIIVGRGKPAI